MKTALLTIFALIAFAANSLFCRMALGNGGIDAASFTTIRILSGAVALLVILAFLRHPYRTVTKINWMSACLLFAYAAPFSFAYVSLSTGTGALILFGAVQSTMIIAALLSGERPHLLVWIGLLAALSGLTYLVAPGLSAPPLGASLLMAVAGIAWGAYSLRGRRIGNDPLLATTRNFVGSVPLVMLVSLIMIDNSHLTAEGILLAVLSGAIASGCGYVVWYYALKGLSATNAATVQLSVPVIAAVAGLIVLEEAFTIRLLLASVFILGGVALSLRKR